MTSLPKTFIGYSSDLPPATLDLNFAGNKSLTDNITSTNLVTFTRASSGTYVAANGLITQAVVNVLLWSESFEQASWSKSTVTVTPDTIEAPDGNLTADLLQGLAGTAVKYIYNQFVTTIAGTYTFSVFLKAGTEQYAVVRLNDQTGVNDSQVVVNLINGTLSAVTSFGTNTGGAATITNVGNGWYRVSLTTTFNAAVSALQSAIFLFAYSTISTTTNLYIWGAQLQTGSTANEYIRTTSVINSAPRFDHNPVTGESLGLLVEEQRTNLLLSSELIGGTSWTNQNSLTVVTNSTDVTDPAGGTTASKLTAGSTTSQTLQSAILTTTQYAGSVYLRTQSGTANVTLYVFLQVSPFTLIGTTSATVTTAWQRLSLVTSTATAASYNLGLQITTNGATVYAWGAQLEVGAFPTSYIPTTTATVTRSADVASISGSKFSSWYNQGQMSLYAEWQYPFTPSAFPRVWDFQNATGATDSFGISTNRFNHNRFGARVSSIVLFDTQAGPDAIAGQKVRSVFGIQTGNYGYGGQGAQLVTNTSASVSINIDNCGIGQINGGGQLNGTIKRITYWPTRLPNTSLQEMTK